jgi:hypothetical protein
VFPNILKTSGRFTSGHQAASVAQLGRAAAT